MMTKEVEIAVGQYVVVEGYSGFWSDEARLRPDVFRVDAVTPKMVKQQVRDIRGNPIGRYDVKRRDQVLAVFTDEKAARQFVQAVDGIRGEMERRQRAAQEWAAKALNHKLAQVSA